MPREAKLPVFLSPSALQYMAAAMDLEGRIKFKRDGYLILEFNSINEKKLELYQNLVSGAGRLDLPHKAASFSKVFRTKRKPMWRLQFNGSAGVEFLNMVLPYVRLRASEIVKALKRVKQKARA